MDALLRKKRKEILRILAGHGATNVRVFGSRVRGQARAGSDLDILVDTVDQGPWGVRTTQELEDALGCPVDLVEEKLLNRYRRDRILREAVPLEPGKAKETREDINHVAADMPDDWARLRDILDATRLVERYASAGRAAFQDEEMRQDAMIRRMEIIGEAVNKLSPASRLDWPGIPWRDMVDERNRLIHNYNEVNLEKVWERATVDLPVLREQVQAMLERMEQGQEGLPPR